MAVRNVIRAGDPRLKADNKLLNKLDTPEVKKLIRDLVSTMYKVDLIGIAAPQIGENSMIFVTHPRSTKARKIGKTDKLRIFINPKITFKSKDQNLIYEGCGSVSDFGPVLRPREIEVEATDENGKKFRLKSDGILARVIQHEYDHLNGIEFIQKVSDYSKIIVQEHYRKQIRNSPLQRKNSLITKIEFRDLN
ncbi:MAG: peptide deformylase [Candidatus Levybacteria bacterium]|nr:peptide deformylase [Candidatus Levybacteria bacterium]